MKIQYTFKAGQCALSKHTTLPVKKFPRDAVPMVCLVFSRWNPFSFRYDVIEAFRKKCMQTQQNIPLNNIRLPENFRRQMYISYNFDKCISSSGRLVYNTLPLAIQLPSTSGRTFLLLPCACIKYLTWIWLRPVVHIYVAIYLYI